MALRHFLDRFSIKQKLVGITLITSLAVLGVTCGSLLIFEILAARKATVRNLSAIANIVSENSSAALIFEDQKLAQEIMSGMRIEPEIFRAVLFNQEGKIVGNYPANAAPPQVPSTGARVTLNFRDFSLYNPVVEGHRRVGTLYLQGTFDGTYQRLGIYAVVLFAVMVCSVIIALSLSAFFQRSITEPLLNLAQTARSVSANRDYSVRARKMSEDELGAMTEAFNAMLDQIEHAHFDLRESEERFRTLADNMAQLAWMADELGSAIWYNKRWYDYTGTDLAAMKGRGWEKLHHPDHLDRVKQHLQDCFTSEKTWEDTFPLRGKDGHYRWFLSRAIPIRSFEGRVVRWFGTNTDVTEQRLVEEALTQARDNAVRAARTKDDFLAALSHELRTPLSPVLLIASDAAQNPEFPPAARDYFEIIRKNVALEARLIDDLLDLTAITRGKLVLNRSTFSLHDVLFDALGTIKPEVQEKQLKLILRLHPEPAHVIGDAIRIQQVLWNVLKNAVKFTPPDGNITVSTRVLDESKAVEIEVSDTGIGLKPGEIAKVFDAFSQGEHAGADSVHRFGGLGLGLAISRSILELHAGRITASSAGRNQGSTFFITLPLAPENAPPLVLPLLDPPVQANNGILPATRRVRILLVEDHVPTRNAISFLLKKRPFEVVSVGTMAEARSAIATGTFEILISDIGLPDGDGHELMREIRNHHNVSGIALTGYGMEEDVEQTLAAGFLVHLTKPIQVSALENAIAKVLGGIKP